MISVFMLQNEWIFKCLASFYKKAPFWRVSQVDFKTNMQRAPGYMYTFFRASFRFDAIR